jgi:tRNA A37 N6-isopentenylltransferase MiaA
VTGPRLWAIVGATGTGKSDLAIDLAERLRSRGNPAEIVNADAMQLYRGMDVGTAKVSISERRGIPHHLFDVLQVDEDAAVAVVSATGSCRSGGGPSSRRGCDPRGWFGSLRLERRV